MKQNICLFLVLLCVYLLLVVLTGCASFRNSVPGVDDKRTDPPVQTAPGW